MREAIFSPELVAKFKMEEQDFTRNRKQPFSATLLFMLNLLRRSLAIEIDGFVRYLSGRLSSGGGRHFTSSAFIQNRKKIDPAVFNHLSSVIIENFYIKGNGNLRLLNGFRVLAVDGSRITLPFTAELKKHYGVVKNQSKAEVVQARTSVLYDVLNGITLDAVLDNLNKGEREMALRHAHRWKAGDLVIYDRGYPSYDFINEHMKLGTECLIRTTTAYSSIIIAFAAGGKKSIVTEICPGKNQPLKDKEYDKNTALKLRLIRIDLPGGETEVLLTTLLDSTKYPTKMFRELYFPRTGASMQRRPYASGYS